MGFNFPNITIRKIFKDGELTRYEARPNEGYVMYDPNDESEEVYYPEVAGFPKDYNFDRFPYVAISRSSVVGNNIFEEVAL